LLLMNGLAMGLFASPNRAAIMNSLPADQRGQGSGMSTTTQNSAMVLSIGIFFTLIITGLAAHLPATLAKGLTAQGVPAAAAARVAHLPPTATVFGAFLGYNPIASLLGPTGVLARLPHARVAYLTGRSFFPNLISAPFSSGLHEAFDFAIVAMLIAAAASWLRGKPRTQPDPSPGLNGSRPAATDGRAGRGHQDQRDASRPAAQRARHNGDLRPGSGPAGSGTTGNGREHRSVGSVPAEDPARTHGENPLRALSLGHNTAPRLLANYVLCAYIDSKYDGRDGKGGSEGKRARVRRPRDGTHAPGLGPRRSGDGSRALRRVARDPAHRLHHGHVHDGQPAPQGLAD
jgi:hypothetical protein